MTATAEYDPWGRMLAHDGMEEATYTFVGAYGVRRMGPVSGAGTSEKYIMGVRHYDAYPGRFLQEDPIGFQGGDMNLMRYAKNNPVRYIDPMGLSATDGDTLSQCAQKCADEYEEDRKNCFNKAVDTALDSYSMCIASQYPRFKDIRVTMLVCAQEFERKFLEYRNNCYEWAFEKLQRCRAKCRNIKCD